MSEASHVVELPLFLLHTVLFPHMALPLRIFESRYRKMLDYCMERGRIFGVLLIKSGQEVAGPAVPFTIGTSATVREVQQQADGTLAASTLGVQRFRLLEMAQVQPFPLGFVEYLEESAQPTPPPELVEEVSKGMRRCLQLSLALSGEWVRQMRLPSDPAVLSYMAAARLSVDLVVKQKLLEAPNAAVRLEEELPLLATEQERLHGAVLERMWLRSASLN